MKPTGITVPLTVHEDSRRALVADRADHATGPAATASHSRWVEHATLTHAALPVADRLAAERRLPPLPTGTSTVKRAFALSSEALDAIETALDDELADRDLNRSRSAFIVAAIRIAIETARARRGGTLPQAPDRLPNVRRRRTDHA